MKIFVRSSTKLQFFFIYIQDNGWTLDRESWLSFNNDCQNTRTLNKKIKQIKIYNSHTRICTQNAKYDICHSYICIIFTHTHTIQQVHRRTIARILTQLHNIIYIYVLRDQQISISEIEYITLAAVCSLYHYYPIQTIMYTIYTLPHRAAISD